MLRPTVKKKLLIGTIGIVLGLGVAMLLLVRIVLYDNLSANLQKRGAFIAAKVAQDSVTPVLTERLFDLQMMINDVKRSEKDIVFIFVLSDDGEVLAHTFEKGFPEDLRALGSNGRTSSERVHFLETKSGTILDFTAPLFRGAGGTVHVGMAEEPIRQEVNNALFELFAGLIAVLLLGSGAAIVLSFTITRPIHLLAVAVEAVEKGKLSVRVPVRSNDEIGNLAAAFNSMADARERIEDALRHSERKLRDITASLGEGVLVVDPAGRATFLNPAAERLLGWSEAELLGRPVHDIVHNRKADGSTYPAAECPSLNVPATGEPVHVDDDIYVRKDGSEFPVSFISAPVMEDGKVIAVVTAFQDITQRKQREAEREKLMIEHLEALTQVRTLSGMLPICSSCKKVRDDAGYWKQIEAYISEHSDAEFSHSICPECAKKLYPDYYDKLT